MTAQQSEILINDSDVDLESLRPYFVRREDRSSAFPVVPILPESSGYSSALYRGCIATMRLHSDYRLELERFDFPLASNAPSQICNTYFTGDFCITFRSFFFGPNTTVPFRDGRIVREVKEWQIDDKPIEGVVFSVVRSRHTNKPIGLFVDVSAPAFAPISLVPSDFRDDLDAMVGRRVLCRVERLDEHDRPVLLIESADET